MVSADTRRPGVSPVEEQESPDGGIGPLADGGYPVPEAPTDPGSTRERWIWTAIVVGTGLLIFGLMVFGGFGGVRPDLQQVSVEDVLTSTQLPAERFGSNEIRITGWFAQITAGCSGDTGGADAAVSWLQATARCASCSRRDQAASPARASSCAMACAWRPPTASHFRRRRRQDRGRPASSSSSSPATSTIRPQGRCVPARVTQCRNTFVVSEYSG